MKKQGYKEIKIKETIYYDIEENYEDSTKQENTLLNKEKNTIAYIYINSKSLDTLQEQKCLAELIITEYAYKNNLEISEYYIDCVPNEINKDNRVCLNKLLELVEKEQIGQILVPDIDHISKSSLGFKYVLECASEKNVQIVCCNGNWVFG